MADVTISQLDSGVPNSSSSIPFSSGSSTLKTTPANIVAASPGCILQVLQVVKTDVSKTNNNVPNFEDIPGLTINITPKAATSKVLVNANVLGSSVDNSFVRLMRNINGGAYTHIYTNTTTPGNRTLVSMGDFYNAGSPGTRAGQQNTSIFLDSPNTTSVVNYKLQYCTRNGNDFAINTTYYDANQNYQILGASSITLMEVAG